MTFEKIIFSHLLYNEPYGRKVIAFLKDEYFQDYTDKIIFSLIDNYVKKYNSFPSKETLFIDLSNRDGVSEDQFKKCKDEISELSTSPDTALTWLIDETEKFCQEKAIYNAIMKSIQIIDDKTGKLLKGSIPQVLSDALSVSFDTHIGHSYLDDAEKRFEYYHIKQTKIPFDIEYLNKITKGGVSSKTLNIILAGCVHPETKVKIRYRKKFI